MQFRSPDLNQFLIEKINFTQYLPLEIQDYLISHSYDGFGGSVVNNMEGIGYAVVTAQGVPVIGK